MKYSWVISIDKDIYTIQFFHSKITRKFRVFINGTKTYYRKGVKPREVRYSQSIKDNKISIKYVGKRGSFCSEMLFNLFINDKEIDQIKTTKRNPTCLTDQSTFNQGKKADRKQVLKRRAEDAFIRKRRVRGKSKSKRKAMVEVLDSDIYFTTVRYHQIDSESKGI